jgi:hypothetical protein
MLPLSIYTHRGATDLQSKEITPYKTSSNERRKVKSLPHARSTMRSGLVVENGSGRTLNFSYLNISDGIMVETKKAEEKSGSKEGSKHPAYKILNLLYEAIIDNSFKQRKNDEF